MECARTMAKSETIERRIKNKNCNIALLIETKKKLKGTKDLDNYVMIYSIVNLAVGLVFSVV